MYTDQSALLQVDATIITGILILLTIKSFNVKKIDADTGLKRNLRASPTFLATFIIIPFVVSAIAILLSNDVNDFRPTIFAIIGFAYIAIILSVLAIIDLLKK